MSVWDRDSVCVEQTQCLCGTHTVSLCGTHTVQGGGAGGFAYNSNPTLGLPSPPTHTKLLSRSCGEIMSLLELLDVALLVCNQISKLFLEMKAMLMLTVWSRCCVGLMLGTR